MLTNIITTYLQTHKRIVVPQLGAFLMKQPEGRIIFSELMKRDDGVLRGLLCAQGHNEIEAMGIIDRFVFETRHAVSHEGFYRIDGLGTLTIGSNGALLFEYDPSTATVEPEAAPEPETPAQPEETAKEEATEPAAEPQEIVSTEDAPKEAIAEDPEPAKASEEVIHEPAKRVEEIPESRSVGQSIGENPHVSNSAKMNPEPYVRGLRYSKPAKNTDAYSYVDRGSSSGRFDRFLLIALFALAIGVAVIIYGWWCNRQSDDLQEQPQQVEQTAEQPTNIATGTLQEQEGA